ncbi:MAG: CBS domain-containing protein [Solirubrobacterales bacterium]
MDVRDVMTSRFEMIDSTKSLTEAAREMKSLDVGILPVREGTRLIGVITDRDIVIRGLAGGRNPDSAQVKDIISSDVVYCYDDDSVEEAARLMEEHQVRRLIVCDRDKTPVGIVSLGDLAVKAEQGTLSGEILERISEPAAPAR